MANTREAYGGCCGEGHLQVSESDSCIRTSREVGSCDLGDQQVQSLWAGSSGASLSPRAVGRQNSFLLRTGQIHLSRPSFVWLTFPQRINLPNLKCSHLNISLTKDILTEASRISKPILSRCPDPATVLAITVL